MGHIYKRGDIYWLKYYRDGRPIYESSHSPKGGAAKDLLRMREGDIARGVPITPRLTRCTIDELLADVVTDYRVNAKRSLKQVERRIKKHVKPFFGGWRAAAISSADVKRYVAERLEKGAANASINRELAILKRAFSLGMKCTPPKVLFRPYIGMLKEDNVRTGFFEWEQFEKVRGLLSPALQPVVSFAYVTGWRTRSEILPLEWSRVDFQAEEIRLDVGATKNREGRVIKFTAELREVLKAQRAYTDAINREQSLREGRIVACPWVFHRAGKPIKDFYATWRSACRDAGCPGRLLHDFRRTAARTLVREGVPERVAMKMAGWKTRSVFDRYNVTSDGDLVDAAHRLDAAVTKRLQSSPTREAVRMGGAAK